MATCFSGTSLALAPILTGMEDAIPSMPSHTRQLFRLLRVCTLLPMSVQQYLHPLLVVIRLKHRPAQVIPQRLQPLPVPRPADAPRREAEGRVGPVH